MAVSVVVVCPQMQFSLWLRATTRLLLTASFVFTLQPLCVAAKDHSTKQRQLPVFVRKHLLFIHKDNFIFFFPHSSDVPPSSDRDTSKQFKNNLFCPPLDEHIMTMAVKQFKKSMSARYEKRRGAGGCLDVKTERGVFLAASEAHISA